MDHHKLIREFVPEVVKKLYRSVEYKRSLVVPVGLCFTVGWLGGLSLGKMEDQVAAMLAETRNVDIKGSKEWQAKHQELFTVQYPFIQKVAESYRILIDDLLKISPDVPPANVEPNPSTEANDGGGNLTFRRRFFPSESDLGEIDWTLTTNESHFCLSSGRPVTDTRVESDRHFFYVGFKRFQDILRVTAAQLEKRRKLRTSGLNRLRKVGSASKVESSNDVSLGAQEDASKQGRKIADLDADAEVTLIDETQERYDEEMFFDVQDDLQVTTAGEVVTTASATTTIDELTLAQTLIEIKAAKPKVFTTSATTTTTTTTRPKARGVVVQDPSEFKTTSSPSQASQLPQTKDKGKAKMVEPKKPLKKKDQIALDKEVARNLEAQLQAELEEEERLARQKE
ncbi:hypothetical protein Tco_1506647 [Tanacetum coccineum]